ncbi:MAG: DUF3820 family protein [Planctomycetes bacterium]|nr:DUF3820 family protein [Planctomycetota bacterium]
METPRLKDKDKMPFGKHKGTTMERVPPGYLLWLGDQKWISGWPQVKGYIEHNRNVLEKEIANPNQYR